CHRSDAIRPDLERDGAIPDDITDRAPEDATQNRPEPLLELGLREAGAQKARCTEKPNVVRGDAPRIVVHLDVPVPRTLGAWREIVREQEVHEVLERRVPHVVSSDAHRISSSARAVSDGGIVSLSAFAVTRLMMRRNLVAG